MSTLEELNSLLPPEERKQVLLSAAQTAVARYSIVSEHWSNHAILLAKERSGEMTLADRLLDCVPTDQSWLENDLWDYRESVFEGAWGDTGEEWLAAIIGPPELDEPRAVECKRRLKSAAGSRM